MKKQFLLLISLLICVVVFSQKVQYEDVVYLKNGSVIRGMIIEQVPGETIKIQTADRNIFVFEIEQVEKITKEEVPQGTNANMYRSSPGGEYVGKEKGFESTIDLFFAIQLEWGEPVLGMNAVAGYRFMPQLFVGGGAGAELYFDGTMAPLFLQVRTDFIKSRVTPIFYINSGYAFGWVDGEDGSDWGGIFLEPGVGFRFNIAENFGLNLSSSFKFQRAYSSDYLYLPSYPEGEYHVRVQETYRLFTFKVGFSF